MRVLPQTFIIALKKRKVLSSRFLNLRHLVQVKLVCLMQLYMLDLQSR